MNKYNLIFCSIVLFSAITLSGCELSEGCANIPADPDVSNVHFYNFPEWKGQENEINISKKNVEQCYKNQPFEESKYSIIFSAAKTNPSGGHVLIYEFYGIEDLRAAFLIDKDGKIFEVYRFSTSG